MKALFVTFEGGDGSGKTTLIAALERRFKQRMSILSVREPGGTKLGETVRSVLLDQDLTLSNKAELALFLAARIQHIEEVIRPSLSKYDLILCDRFHDSSIAYQGAARGLGESFVEKTCLLLTENFQPDLTIYLDISPQDAEMRLEQTKDRIEKEPRAFHEAIRKSYRRLASCFPKRIHTIDASLPKEVVENTAYLLLLQFIKERVDV